MNQTTGVGTPVLKYGARFAQIDFKTSGGTDHYDSLQTTLNRRFSRGLTAGLQWTYGHSIGDTGEDGVEVGLDFFFVDRGDQILGEADAAAGGTCTIKLFENFVFCGGVLDKSLMRNPTR